MTNKRFFHVEVVVFWRNLRIAEDGFATRVFFNDLLQHPLLRTLRHLWHKSFSLNTQTVDVQLFSRALTRYWEIVEIHARYDKVIVMRKLNQKDENNLQLVLLIKHSMRDIRELSTNYQDECDSEWYWSNLSFLMVP